MLCLQLSWDMYLFKILSRSHVTVGADTEVVVLHEGSLVQLCAVVGSYNKDAQKARYGLTATPNGEHRERQ